MYMTKYGERGAETKYIGNKPMGVQYIYVYEMYNFWLNSTIYASYVQLSVEWQATWSGAGHRRI
jgi:hypothetical protein